MSLTVEGPTLVLGTTAATARTARATMEDLIACLQAAERLPAQD